MATFLFIVFLILSLVLAIAGCRIIFDSGNDVGWVLSSIGVFILALTLTLYISYSTDMGKVEALVESSKYVIVTHEDYSLKELEQFKCIGGVYLKEVE